MIQLQKLYLIYRHRRPKITNVSAIPKWDYGVKRAETFPPHFNAIQPITHFISIRTVIAPEIKAWMMKVRTKGSGGIFEVFTCFQMLTPTLPLIYINSSVNRIENSTVSLLTTECFTLVRVKGNTWLLHMNPSSTKQWNQYRRSITAAVTHCCNWYCLKCVRPSFQLFFARWALVTDKNLLCCEICLQVRVLLSYSVLLCQDKNL
jgi:hypothetical protein